MKKIFTTGDVARICRVTINTVVKWFDSGDMGGYRIPSSGARRIPRKDLMDFMREFNFPLDEILSDKYKILVVDNRPKVLTAFRKAFSDSDNYSLETAVSGFEAGLLTKDFMPDMIFLDVDLGNIDADKIINLLKATRETPPPELYAISSDMNEKTITALKKRGYSEVIKSDSKPSEIRKIAKMLNEPVNELAE